MALWNPISTVPNLRSAFWVKGGLVNEQLILFFYMAMNNWFHRYVCTYHSGIVNVSHDDNAEGVNTTGLEDSDYADCTRSTSC